MPTAPSMVSVWAMPNPQDLLGGFVPTMPLPEPVTPLPTQPISLCELGPCVRFHEFRHKLDAQEPQDGSPGHIYTMSLRTCYPHDGVEFDLSDTPIRECNLWQPSQDLVNVRRRAREEFKTSYGEQWAAFEASWPEPKCDNCGEVAATRAVGSQRWCLLCVNAPGDPCTPDFTEDAEATDK